MLKYFFVTFFCGILTYANPLRISARQIGPTEEDRRIVTEKLLKHPVVLKALDHKDYRVIAASLEDRPFSSGVDYIVHIFNYTDATMLRITGPSDFSVLPKIQMTIEDVAASPEEYEEAVQMLSENSDFSQGLISGDIVAYEPMPSTLSSPDTFRGIGGPRIVGVGLRSQTDPTVHEIVGVNLSSMQVVRFENKAPPTSLATLAVCGLPNAGQAVTGKGRAGTAQIDINDDSGSLWNFVVIRPSASSGSKGSGLEIRNVYYKGKLILARAHTPILNVQYAGGVCGPYRDWSYAENYFNAVGSDEVPGIRIASQPPTTIFDTGNDRGNFRGVAIYQSEDKVTLVTEFSAGWYRYASKFELYSDGTIKPIFQFSAVRNSCVCYTHHHHVYWRFDFDLDGKPNSALVSNGSEFRPVDYETMFRKNEDNKYWRITSSDENSIYDVMPGENDGAADYYGIADAWLLRQKSNEIDDNRIRTSTRAALNSFVTGENIFNQDLVMWYSGHFMHSHDDMQKDHEGELGPTLTPITR